MAANDLTLSIGANSAPLNSDLERAQQTVKRWSRDTQDSAKQAEHGFDGVSGAVKDFSREQRMQGRVGSFFTKELAEIAPVSDSAKMAIGSLTGALAGGVGLGMAFDLVLTGVKLVAEHFRSTSEEAKQFAKEIDGIREVAEKARKELQHFQLIKRGVPEHLAGVISSGDTQKLDEAEVAINTQLRQMKADYERTATGSPMGRQMMQNGFSLDDVLKRFPAQAEEYKKHREKLEGELAEISASRKAQEGTASKQDQYEEKVRRDQQGLRIAGIETAIQAETALTDVTKLQIEQAQKLRELDLREKTAKGDEIAGIETEKTKTRELYAEKVRIARIRAQFATETPTEDMGQEANLRKSPEEIQRDWASRDLVKKQEAYNRAVKDSIDVGKQWGETMGDVFGKLSTGHASLMDVVKAGLGQMARSIIQSAITQIQANAVVTGTEAAKSQAGIPVIGPALAVGALAAMQAIILAQLSNLPSAEGGWKVPRGINPVTQLHSGEHVIPERIARNYEEGVRGGGNTFNINALDGPSVEKTLKKHGTDIVRSLERQQRRRRRGD